MTSEHVVRRARALVGVRFRPQGRSAESGVECIGLVAIAAGVPVADVRRDYALRDGDATGLHAEFARAGLRRIDAGAAGDVMVVEAGFSQVHAVVLTDGGFVHADAGMRRVVEVPGVVGWPVLSLWRVSGAG